MAAEKKGLGQALVVLLFAAAGCLAIVAATAFRRDLVPDRTDLRMWWIGYQGLAGFLLYWVGHAIAVALTVRHWPDPQPSCFDPLAVWRYALYHLPKTRWALTYGLWGATAFSCAAVLFLLNDFALKDKHHQAEDSRRSGRPSGVRRRIRRVLPRGSPMPPGCGSAPTRRPPW